MDTRCADVVDETWGYCRDGASSQEGRLFYMKNVWKSDGMSDFQKWLQHKKS